MQLSRKRQRKGIHPTGGKVFHHIEPYLFLLPAMVVFGVFLFYPFIRTIYLSFFLVNRYAEPVKYVAFQNYINIFNDRGFWKSLTVTFQFVLIVAGGGLVIGLCTSLLTAKKYPGNAFASATYAMPVAIASAAASMAFKMIFLPTPGGLLNSILGTSINWTGDAQYALGSVAGMSIWLTSGINFIFISAGLRNIPDELYESASIDGASGPRKFWHITLPGLSPTLFFQVIINIIGAFQSFTQIRLLTKGGPGDATNVIVYNIYLNAFENMRYHTAASLSVILFLIILVITLVQFSFEKRSVNY